MLVHKELQFEITTPCYLGGVEPRRLLDGSWSEEAAKADTRLRLRPIVAMWAYWYRALLAGAVGPNLKTIHRSEHELFGGVAGDGFAKRFRASLSVEHEPDPRVVDYTEQSPDKARYASYLGFGLHKQERKRDDRREVRAYQRWALTSGTLFRIELTCEKEVWNDLSCAIYYWSVYGGLGARHSRGFGSIQWLNFQPQVAETWTLLRNRVANLEAPAPFDTCHHDTWRVRRCQLVFESFNDALTAIRHQLRTDYSNPPGAPDLCLGARGYGWRQRVTPKLPPSRRGRTQPVLVGRDHDQAAIASDHGRGPITLKNAVFGLPIAYSTWGGMIVEPWRDREGKRSERLRRPSPLSFHVTKVAGGYQVLAILFRTRFLPEGVRIEANGVAVNQPANLDDLEEFLNAIDGSDLNV